MEYNLRSAIVDLKKQEEPGINYIYAKTYNYVYLRAKSILRRDHDVLQLMQDVYVKLIRDSAEIEVENLYEWLGECTYKMGCGYYRKKKVREADILESEDKEFSARMIEEPEITSEVVAKSLEELPDLHQATFYAFYYDYMSVGRIAKLMDCSKGVVINRLNYTRKYMTRALGNKKDETGVNVFYSVDGMCMALRSWSMENCISVTAAQTVYADICKATDIAPALLDLEGKEYAGAKNTVVFHQEEDYAFLEEQMAKYGKKFLPNKKILIVLAGIVVAVAVLVLIITSAFNSKKDKKEEKKEPTKVEEQKKEDDDKKDDEEYDFGIVDTEDPDGQEDSSEYIFADSNERVLSDAEIEALTTEQVRFALNEIYARHGVTFGPAELQSYFSEKSWYTPKMTLDEFQESGSLTDAERENISKIAAVYERKLSQ